MTEEAKTASVMLGGTERNLPELNFKGLKVVWPHLKRVWESREQVVDPLEAVTALLVVIVASLRREDDTMNLDKAEDLLKPAEIPGLQASVLRLLEISGIQLKTVVDGDAPGEASPAGEGADQTAASTETSAV